MVEDYLASWLFRMKLCYLLRSVIGNDTNDCGLYHKWPTVCFMLQACLQSSLFSQWSRLLVSESATSLHGSSLRFHVWSVQWLAFCTHQLSLSAVIRLMWCDVMPSSRVILRSFNVMDVCISLFNVTRCTAVINCLSHHSAVWCVDDVLYKGFVLYNHVSTRFVLKPPGL